MHRSVSLGIAALVIACGGDERALAPPPLELSASSPEPDPDPEPLPVPPPVPDFPEGTRSLRLTRTIAVRHAPGTDAVQIGTIAEDTRVAWRRTADGAGCKRRWVEMEPRGWICADYVEPLTKPASGVELPRLERGEVVPGTYGKLIEAGAMVYARPEPGKAPDPAGKQQPTPVSSPGQVEPAALAGGERMVELRPLLGSVNVRKYGELTVGGKPYWKVARGNEYVLAKAIRQHTPSRYQGVRLGDDTGLELPLAFIWPRKAGVTTLWSRRAPKGPQVRKLEQRTPLSILETHVGPDGAPVAYRIGEAEWVDAAEVRVAQVAEPPPLIGRDERWVDIDLDTQILVAYEGTRPVYATMVSTGRKANATDTGTWRMWRKMSETDMRDTGEDPYSVATVPWTQFFEEKRGYALHAAYWHDRFGIPRSHGCVNLAPADARWLYFWTDPQVPPGWTMTAGVLAAPGSIVRVRSAADPNPEFKRYAKKVQEEREARARSRPTGSSAAAPPRAP